MVPPRLFCLLNTFGLHPCVTSASTKLVERSRFTTNARPLLVKYPHLLYWGCMISRDLTLLNPAGLELYFAEMRRAHPDLNKYDPSLISNMDETCYAIGASQKSRVIIARPESINETLPKVKTKATKVAADRQEWATTVECILAAGKALPSLVIFGGVSEILQSWIPKKKRSSRRLGMGY